MEDNAYCEMLVKVKTTKQDVLLSKLFWIMTVVFFAGTFITVISLIPCAAFLAAALVWRRRVNMEYEYLYVDGSLQVDKIIAKQKRKKCGEYDVENLYLMAPEGDEQLNQFLNRKDVKRADYSAHDPESPNRYVAVYRGKEMLCMTFEPKESLVQMMWRAAPTKVIRKRKEY